MNQNKKDSCAIAVRSVVIDKNYIILEKGKSETLTATIISTNAEFNDVCWESNNKSVVTVKNGVITAVDSGNAVIIASATDKSGKYATCFVVVVGEDIPVEYIYIQKPVIILPEGQSIKICADIYPCHASNQELSWSSSDYNVAYVNQSGIVVAVSSGKAQIKATAKDGSGKFAICTVYVQYCNPLKLML